MKKFNLFVLLCTILCAFTLTVNAKCGPVPSKVRCSRDKAAIVHAAKCSCCHRCHNHKSRKHKRHYKHVEVSQASSAEKTETVTTTTTEKVKSEQPAAPVKEASQQAQTPAHKAVESEKKS